MKKVTVDARAFADAMSKVSKVPKKSAIHILEEVAVSIKDDRCALTATDLETWLVAELPAQGDDMSFVFQRTKDVMKACAHFEGELALTLDTEDKKNWKLELHCGQRAATFTAASHEDYPECRTVENDASLRVNAAELFCSVERVRYAVQRADPSTNPKAACIQFRGNRIFSLDGRRMACDSQPDTVFPLPCLLSGDALVHLKAFGESEVTMQVDERAVCFSSGTLKLYARRYGADTYDPDTAIPQKYQEVITVRTDELIRELTYLKECAGVCAYPYVRFAGENLSMNAPSGHLATHVSMSGRGNKTVSIEDATVEEFRNSIDLGGDITHLLERLTLMEYLYLPNNDYFLSSIDDQIAFLEDRLESNIKMWDSTLRGIDDQYEAFCFLAALSTVRMQAKSNRIHYFYDYGDGWEVSVELIDAFYPDSLDEQDDSIRTAVSSHAPVCIKADGLPVLEDVGGIHGYADFLLTLHHSQDGVEREEIREWARSLGWTGRAIKPKNML